MASLVSRDTSGVLQAQDGEREDLRTRSAKRFLVQTFPDGRKQYRVGATIGPVHYKTDPFDATEAWKEIDLTIRPAGKGKGWQYEVTDNGYQVRIWERYMLPWHYTAEFRRAGEWVRMAPVELRYTNAAGERQTIAEPKKNIKPVIDNDAYTVTWQDCFGTGLHFRYNITPDQFAKTVVIDAPDALPAATIDSEGLRVEIVMALSWSGQAGNGFGRGRDLSVLHGPEDAEEERKPRYGKHPHLRQDGLAALWLPEPRAWDAEGEALPMEWGLERKGRRVYGSFGVKVADLAEAAWPVAIDTAITEEQVGASDDDTENGPDNNGYPGMYGNPTATSARVGTSTGPFARKYFASRGDRWTTVPIPQGATIDSASVSWNITAITGTINNTIYGSAIDSAVDFSADGENNVYAIFWNNPTTAYVGWNPAATGWQTSGDIASIVSEIVGRAGWSTGNALSLIAVYASQTHPGTTNQVTADTYDGSSANAAKFNCTYTEGTPTPTGNPIWYYNMLRRAN